MGGLHGHCEFQRPVAEALAEHFEVWCPSLPGESNPELAPGTIEEIAQQILTWTAGAGLDRFLLCGISLGGAIALAMAVAAPERIQGIASVVSFAEYRFLHPRLKQLFDHLIRRGRERMCRRVSRSTLLALSVHELLVERAPRPAVDAYGRRFRDYRSPGDLVWRRLKMMRHTALLEHLEGLPMPVLLVGAARDWLVHPDHMVEAARRIRNARLEIIPASGHLFPFLRPERLAAIVTPFFEELIANGRWPIADS